MLHLSTNHNPVSSQASQSAALTAPPQLPTLPLLRSAPKQGQGAPKRLQLP